MYEVVSWSIVITFVALLIITILGMLGVLEFRHKEHLNKLFALLILEVVSIGFLIYQQGQDEQNKYFREASALYQDALQKDKSGDHEKALETLKMALQIPQDDPLIEKLIWIGIFDDVKIELDNATPAQILEVILKRKWTLEPKDKDMIVMYHKFGYRHNGKEYQIDASMVVKGEDQTYTAMAKTVGLPIAIATLAILNEKIVTPGVQIPLSKEVYDPILKELKEYGIHFNEKEVPYLGYNPLNQ